QVTTVPKRRPPRPHSCSRSRSPLRQCAAMKPRTVMRANSSIKIMRATQLTSATAILLVLFVDPRLLPAIRAGCVGRPTCLILSDEINDGGQDGSDDHPEHLIPVEERYPDPGRIDPVVEGDPQAGDELDRKQQVPPAPAGVGTVPSGVWLIHFAAARPRGAVDRSSTPAHWRQFRLSADWCEFRLGKDTDAVLPSSSRLPRWISGAPAEEV